MIKDELTMKFVEDAELAGLYQIKGHRLVGGLRASIYNAMPIEGVEALINFMMDFELKNK
jgi:phosphoserine aminotransferase